MLSLGEVTRYKAQWEQQCAVLNREDESTESEDEDDDESSDEIVPADLSLPIFIRKSQNIDSKRNFVLAWA